MKNFLITHAFSLISGPIVGVIVYALHEQLQRAWAWLDKQGPWAKRAVAFVLALLITPVAGLFGATVPAACVDQSGAHLQECFLALGDQAWLGAAVGGAVALLIHKITHPTKTS